MTPVLLSEVSWHKRCFAKRAGKRFAWLLGKEIDDPSFVKNLEVLEKNWDCDWIAVIHADGNGLGQLFLDFAAHARKCGASTVRDYVDMYRRFSRAIDRVSLAAFRQAAPKIPAKKDPAGIDVYPILPIVVGGDDLTVVCEGTHALDFTVEFLSNFETLLHSYDKNSALTQLLSTAFGVPRLGMCAGVAIVKPHFPFFTAYRVAEDLIRSAKDVRKKVTDKAKKEVPSSALDFHIVYDSAVVNLETVRHHLGSGDKIRLYAKPFVTTPVSVLGAMCAESAKWVKAHSWESFVRAHDALNKPSPRDQDRRALPNSQAHQVRSLLHNNPAEAEILFERLKSRYRADGFIWGEEKLFFDDPDDPKPIPERKLTIFQDALEALHFYGQ